MNVGRDFFPPVSILPSLETPEEEWHLPVLFQKAFLLCVPCPTIIHLYGEKQSMAKDSTQKPYLFTMMIWMFRNHMCFIVKIQHEALLQIHIIHYLRCFPLHWCLCAWYWHCVPQGPAAGPCFGHEMWSLVWKWYWAPARWSTGRPSGRPGPLCRPGLTPLQGATDQA